MFISLAVAPFTLLLERYTAGIIKNMVIILHIRNVFKVILYNHGYYFEALYIYWYFTIRCKSAYFTDYLYIIIKRLLSPREVCQFDHTYSEHLATSFYLFFFEWCYGYLLYKIIVSRVRRKFAIANYNTRHHGDWVSSENIVEEEVKKLIEMQDYKNTKWAIS